MNIINIENLTKGYGERVLFDKVNLGIHEGDKIGIVGINGSGKSTFLKMLAGLEEPDAGNIIWNKQADAAYLAQNTEFREEDTILSYVMRGKKTSNPHWNLEAEANAILKKLYIQDTSAKLLHLSGGERKRVALAKTLLAPAKVLLLDEPTNHLDNKMVTWLEEYLKRYKGILIMVTHDRYFLDRVTNKIVEIDWRRLYRYEANYSGFLELRQQRIDREAAGYRKVQNILRTELQWVRRGAQARSTKQKARLQRFEEMKSVKAPEEEQHVEMNSLASRMGKKTIEINNVSKAYDGRVLIKDFTYYTMRNEHIGIVGENGCGKTTLLKMILGKELPDSGEIIIGETIKIGYFSQMVEEMEPSKRVIDYIKDVAEYITTDNGMASASQMCERFLFTPEIQYQLIRKLSGGEKRRLYLLKILMSAPNVLILDEPTNDLDIATLTILEDYLDHFEGIVIAVSHDRYFLDRIADRIFAFEENGMIARYEGDYTTYVEKAEQKGTLFTEEKKQGSGKTFADSRDTWKNNREKKLRFTYQEQKEYETIDGEIAVLEEQLKDIEEEINKAACQYSRLQELSEQKENLDYKLSERMERWIYLNDLAEEIEKQNKKPLR